MSDSLLVLNAGSSSLKFCVYQRSAAGGWELDSRGQLFERRMSGVRRKGRRPDFDASLATLRVLTAFDQERQSALTAASAFLVRHTRTETAALDLRVQELLAEGPLREVDNPFAPEYLLDAVGVHANWPVCGSTVIPAGPLYSA